VGFSKLIQNCREQHEQKKAKEEEYERELVKV
jgi:hypothetical protein